MKNFLIDVAYWTFVCLLAFLIVEFIRALLVTIYKRAVARKGK